MIRVIYRWTVHPEHADTFVESWWEATRYIQRMAPGARGSALLRSQSENDVYVAVARWDSLDAWRANQQGDPNVVPDANAEAMKASMATPTICEIFDELRDWPSFDDAGRFSG
ncbi:Antibiotic biosynthesis monooxygenase [Burkholderia pseudomallei]|uniref:antibiotic biosynthesis monooxygenase family protein n=1 Tax=Burkholderia pseudomallei TaxID=28450 RepID=UPI000F06682E|nr:antibiotic biosynthesis monooxygenase family protein [Burkholderia pseudomallei]VBY40160.1 Antibiotic biosynthesis monooxygenase [Burkholderia pseudomallei]VBY63053.1 Antibiotic biosynthesis monooxygenase [Burkholderia pseudomallei]VBY77244.1 Antibiotic biosynthesis monooxygenase [Burkholderia pseudomallei]VBY88196.1 Antibiotic biosynthesis monooxygenase [Burkholderia pseudomallei]